MLCPYCGHSYSKVIDKRDNGDTCLTRRRRECAKCQKRFTTYETVASVELVVVKRDGSKETFDKNKLKKGISKSVAKRPITEEQVDKIANQIESSLLKRKGYEVKSSEIGKMVLTKLKALDTIAYIRFASVYKDFEELKDFEVEMEKITAHSTS
ncbi:transcriptional repressor NrdR [Candidatus Dojkabacteria bacterium]|uniref:Transcriptional repressor NrdR n=1 Tax=Candidatus Dojkabacteria bacterium TaxID=2099670 RepID=A0A955L304_9BACT|nr:transcriptional repressor NrdR [Candidatus Dojkabacteria bacterium]